MLVVIFSFIDLTRLFIYVVCFVSYQPEKFVQHIRVWYLRTGDQLTLLTYIKYKKRQIPRPKRRPLSLLEICICTDFPSCITEFVLLI